MTETAPTNDNRSFRALLKNPKRDRADAILMAAIDEMREQGIDRATIIRNLYEFFVFELMSTADSGQPNDIEHVENIAIIEEVDANWRYMREKWKDKFPDLFFPHG